MSFNSKLDFNEWTDDSNLIQINTFSEFYEGPLHTPKDDISPLEMIFYRFKLNWIYLF